MINMLQKIGIKSKSDNKRLREEKHVPANNNHFKVTFSPQDKPKKTLTNPIEYYNYSNNNKRKDPCDQFKYRENPLRSDRSTDSVPVRLSDPCIVQWKNRDVYVYTVESGEEKRAYPDLEFVIYIPVDTPVEWNLPTGVISTQTVSSSVKQKRGKRPALVEQEGNETSEGENQEKHKGHEIREDEDHEKQTGKQHKKQMEQKISEISDTEGEDQNHEKHKGHEIREDEEHEKQTDKQNKKQREQKISESSDTEGKDENHEKHKGHEIREDEEHEKQTGKQHKKQKEHKISKSSDTERAHSRNTQA